MKKIWGILKKHFIIDFHFKHYLFVFGLLVAGLIFNYSLDFEDDYLSGLGGFTKFFGYLVMYSVFYFLTVISYCYRMKRTEALVDVRFWVYAVVGLSLLALDSSLPFLYGMLEKTLPLQIRFWSFKVATNLISFFTVFIPIVIFHYVCERSEKTIYGLQPKQFDTRPYFTMLLIMLPAIILVSFHDSFQKQYPMYADAGAHRYFGTGEWLTISGYEIAYGLDFVTVEFLFRGFLVIGMTRFLDRGAILAMAVVYCTLHFGKPLGEAISSIFGGYILGAVAYETRGIWGGVIVHMGIAWMMELVAFIQEL